ncbi:hypothetical protein Tco_0465021 [Tanacetum coccineum]
MQGTKIWFTGTGKLWFEDIRGRYKVQLSRKPFQRNIGVGNGVAEMFDELRTEEAMLILGQMLLMQAQENGAVEQSMDEEIVWGDSCRGEQVTNVDDDVDYINRTYLWHQCGSIFEADECDAIDSDVC